MDAVVSFLKQNWHRLPVAQWGKPQRMACVYLTPRFRASSHVIAFVMTEGISDPIFVAKIPRLAGDNARLDREAMNLQMIHTTNASSIDSIPKVIAYEDHGEDRLLIETAIAGSPMKPAVVRRRTAQCLEMAIDWLLDLPLAAVPVGNGSTSGFNHLVERPLKRFKQQVAGNTKECEMVEQTLVCLAPLAQARIPSVVEHGDFSHPNVMFAGESKLGVVDWELAEINGLPATDLFVFLSYVAFSQHRAKNRAEYLQAFRKAFFGDEAWTPRFMQRYAEHLRLRHDDLRLLFLACWARYVSGLVARLESDHAIDATTLEWLRGNRYYAMWQYTLEHFGELRLLS